MATCGGCGGRILFGGERWGSWTCCDAACATRLKVALVDEFIPPDVVTKFVDTIHGGACPTCRGAGPVDLYASRTVTGMILAYQISTQSVIGCASCGRKQKLKAALHCLGLGWWGPKALVCNIFILPMNLISSLFVRPATQASPALKNRVKEILAEQHQAAFAEAVRAKAS